MTIKEIIAHHLAQGQSIDFTVSPNNECGDNKTERKINHMHGCGAMTGLIAEIESMKDSDGNYYIGYFTTWSDSFLHSYVKQKSNNVWMYTICLPNCDGKSI